MTWIAWLANALWAVMLLAVLVVLGVLIIQAIPSGIRRLRHGKPDWWSGSAEEYRKSKAEEANSPTYSRIEMRVAFAGGAVIGFIAGLLWFSFTAS